MTNKKHGNDVKMEEWEIRRKTKLFIINEIRKNLEDAEFALTIEDVATQDVVNNRTHAFLMTCAIHSKFAANEYNEFITDRVGSGIYDDDNINALRSKFDNKHEKGSDISHRNMEGDESTIDFMLSEVASLIQGIRDNQVMRTHDQAVNVSALIESVMFTLTVIDNMTTVRKD